MIILNKNEKLRLIPTKMCIKSATHLRPKSGNWAYILVLFFAALVLILLIKYYIRRCTSGISFSPPLNKVGANEVP